MGKRGPKPGSGGRPKKALSEKLIDGNPSKRAIKVLESFSELEGIEMPSPREFLSDVQRDGSEFLAKEIYENVWDWLKERNCTEFVSPELIEHYALSEARMIQAEQLISKYAFLSKHPTTGQPMASPYVSIAQEYMKQARSAFTEIYQIVRENCSTEYKGSPREDLMEKLLNSRRNKNV